MDMIRNKGTIRKVLLSPWTYVAIAFAFIVFSLLAPVVFTNCWCVKYNYSKTGQVGDTIGGLMNPFIAIAGVLMTFLAFYIQKEANDSLAKKTREDKDKLVSDGKALILADMEFSIKDINNRIEDLKFIKEKIEDIDLEYLKINKLSVKMYNRMSAEKRSLLLSTASSLKMESPGTFIYRYYNFADDMQEYPSWCYSKAEEYAADIINDIKEIKELAKKINDQIEDIDYLENTIGDFYYDICETIMCYYNDICSISTFLNKMDILRAHLEPLTIGKNKNSKISILYDTVEKCLKLEIKIRYSCESYSTLIENTRKRLENNRIEAIEILNELKNRNRTGNLLS